MSQFLSFNFLYKYDAVTMRGPYLF